MDLKKPRIDLHIERLALRGVAPGDHRRVRAALERELARLLAEQGTADRFRQNRHEARLGAGTLKIEPQADPDALGTQAARQIHRGLRGDR